MQNTKKNTQVRPKPAKEQEKTKKVKIDQEKHAEVKPKKQVVEEKVKDIKKDVKEQTVDKTHKEDKKKKPTKKIEEEEAKVVVEKTSDALNVEGLELGYAVCGSDKKLALLYTFLKKNIGKKIIVFFSSCNSVKFHAEIFGLIGLQCSSIHELLQAQSRGTIYNEFCEAKSGFLLCTDVAARGLEIPEVDWVIQYDPSDNTKEYLNKVSKTVKGGKAQALVFLLPTELGYLRHLKEIKVVTKEFEFLEHKLANIQPQVEKLVEKNFYVNCAARDGFRAYFQAYISHTMTEIFDASQLDLVKVARAFGLPVPPRVDNIRSFTSGKTEKKSKKKFFDKNNQSQ